MAHSSLKIVFYRSKELWTKSRKLKNSNTQNILPSVASPSHDKPRPYLDFLMNFQRTRSIFFFFLIIANVVKRFKREYRFSR